MTAPQKPPDARGLLCANQVAEASTSFGFDRRAKNPGGQ
jgi:hypothetical protein